MLLQAVHDLNWTELRQRCIRHQTSTWLLTCPMQNHVLLQVLSCHEHAQQHHVQDHSGRWGSGVTAAPSAMEASLTEQCSEPSIHACIVKNSFCSESHQYTCPVFLFMWALHCYHFIAKHVVLL